MAKSIQGHDVIDMSLITPSLFVELLIYPSLAEVSRDMYLPAESFGY